MSKTSYDYYDHGLVKPTRKRVRRKLTFLKPTKRPLQSNLTPSLVAMDILNRTHSLTLTPTSTESSVLTRREAYTGRTKAAAAQRLESSSCRRDYGRHRDEDDQTEAAECHTLSLSLSDLPTPIPKPALRYKYRKFLAHKNVVHFDDSTKCFAITLNSTGSVEKFKDLQSDSFFSAYTAQPWVKFGAIGFHFDAPNTEEKIHELKTLNVKHTPESVNSFVAIKLDSILALWHVTQGRLKSAQILLDKLQPEVAIRQPCDLTAWFYVAQFWLRIKQISLLSSDSARPQQHKEEILQLLRHARAAFQSYGIGYFAWEASVVTWWMFLAQAELIQDAVSELPTSKHRRSLDNDDVSMATSYLKQFLQERSCLAMYPDDNFHQERLISIFQRRMRVDNKDIIASQSSDAQTDTEETPFLADKYREYIAKTRQKLPKCIQRSVLCEKYGKIIIYTLSTESEEFQQFLRTIEYERDEAFYAIRKIRPLTPFDLFADSGNNQYHISEHMTLGGVVFSVLSHHLQNVPSNFDSLFQPLIARQLETKNFKPTLWSLGFAVKDKHSGDVYLVTCCHSVWRVLRSHPLAFLSAHTEVNSQTQVNENRVGEISCTQYLGFYGGHLAEEGTPHLVDILLFRVDEKFLAQSNVDMVLRHGTIPLHMDIYTGDLLELLGTEVYMRGSVSGYRIGKLIDADVHFININGEQCRGGFAVALNNSLKTNQDLSFAREGDSGALVYGHHPTSGGVIAIGLVWGGNSDEHVVAATGELYYHLTYCAPLSVARRFLRDKYGIDAAYYVPESARDSGISSLSGEAQSSGRSGCPCNTADTGCHKESESATASRFSIGNVQRETGRVLDTETGSAFAFRDKDAKRTNLPTEHAMPPDESERSERPPAIRNLFPLMQLKSVQTPTPCNDASGIVKDTLTRNTHVRRNPKEPATDDSDADLYNRPESGACAQVVRPKSVTLHKQPTARYDSKSRGIKSSQSDQVGIRNSVRRQRRRCVSESDCYEKKDSSESDSSSDTGTESTDTGVDEKLVDEFCHTKVELSWRNTLRASTELCPENGRKTKRNTANPKQRVKATSERKTQSFPVRLRIQSSDRNSRKQQGSIIQKILGALTSKSKDHLNECDKDDGDRSRSLPSHSTDAESQTGMTEGATGSHSADNNPLASGPSMASEGYSVASDHWSLMSSGDFSAVDDNSLGSMGNSWSSSGSCFRSTTRAEPSDIDADISSLSSSGSLRM